MRMNTLMLGVLMGTTAMAAPHPGSRHGRHKGKQDHTHLIKITKGAEVVSTLIYKREAMFAANGTAGTAGTAGTGGYPMPTYLNATFTGTSTWMESESTATITDTASPSIITTITATTTTPIITDGNNPISAVAPSASIMPSAGLTNPAIGPLPSGIRIKPWYVDPKEKNRHIYINHHQFVDGENGLAIPKQGEALRNSIVNAKELVEAWMAAKPNNNLCRISNTAFAAPLLYCNLQSKFGIRVANMNQKYNSWDAKCEDTAIEATWLAEAITNTTVATVLPNDIDAAQIPLGENPQGYFQFPVIPADPSVGRTWETFAQTFLSISPEHAIYITLEPMCDKPVNGLGWTNPAKPNDNGVLDPNGDFKHFLQY
ncbi:hypothetical protein TWF694_000396 [Orbilia ellipsospora]|uniref:Uncharacterized protein n=1 Tax=Orbilia ellipsospora TaxID=2528407 RepID=A0AAV9XPV9_9PEZI